MNNEDDSDDPEVADEKKDVTNQAELVAAIQDPDIGTITVKGTIDLTFDTYNDRRIEKNVIIKAHESGGKINGSGNGQERIFIVHPGCDVKLQGLTLDAKDANALTISNSNVQLDNVNITGGGGNDNVSGMAVLVEAGSLHINGGSFTNNHSEGVHGGAIRAERSKVVIKGTNFSNNSSQSVLAQDGVGYTGGAGGAVYAKGGSLSISSSVFSSNEAEGGGNAIYAFENSLYLADTEISNNFGGNYGVYVRSDVKAIVTGCTFDGNTGSGYVGMAAEFTDVDIIDSVFKNHNANTGVINLNAGETFLLDQVTVQDNTILQAPVVSLSNGSGMISNSTFKKNSNGGDVNAAMLSLPTDAEIKATTFENNDAATTLRISNKNTGEPVTVNLDSDTSFIGNTAYYNGGAIEVKSGYSLGQGTNTVISSAHFENNKSMKNGGAVDVSEESTFIVKEGSFVDNSSAENGGAIHAWNGGTLTVEQGEFDTNIAQQNGGAIHIGNSSSMDAKNIVMTDNQAVSGNGGAINTDYTTKLTFKKGRIAHNVAGNKGGGIVAVGEFILNSSSEAPFQITGNKAALGGGLYFGDTYSAPAVLNNIEVTGNTALYKGDNTGHGGGVYAVGKPIQIEEGTVITENEAEYHGGGIGANSSNLIMNDGLIKDNEAYGNGGGIWLNYGSDSGTAKINGGEIADNKVGEGHDNGKGGGLFSEEVKLEIGEATFSGNYASKWGGAMLVYATQAQLDGTAIKNNVAGVEGGGAFFHASKSDINGVLFEENSAKDFGGALVHDEGHAAQPSNVVNSSFVSNSADNGGAIMVYDHKLTLADSSFTSNSAAEDGGAMYLFDLTDVSGDTVTFTSNKSQQGYWIDEADKAQHDTQFTGTITATTPFGKYAYNNHDINYTAGIPYTQTYQVTYNANGSAQAPYIDLANPVTHGDSYTILGNDVTNFARTGYDFVGWNTAANGLGRSYQAGDIISSVTSDIQLYAQWKAKTVNYTVSYYNALNNQKLKTSVVRTGTVDATVSSTAADKSLAGYTYNSSKSTASGKVTADGKLELKLYFSVDWSKLKVEGVNTTYNSGNHAVKVSGTINGDKVAYSVTNSFKDTTSTNVKVTVTRNGQDKKELTAHVTINPATLTIRTEGASRAYNGNELTNQNVHVSGLKGNETLSVVAIGSQTQVGSSVNGYSIDWDLSTAKRGNYRIVEDLGTLQVISAGTVTPPVTPPPTTTDPDPTPREPDEEDNEEAPADDQQQQQVIIAPNSPESPLYEPFEEATENVEELATALTYSVTEAIINREIADNETPLAGLFGGEEKTVCADHYGMVVGIIITAIYTTAVVLRRRKNTQDLDDFDQQVLKGRVSTGTGTQTSGAHVDSRIGEVK